jgi:hypothetical protein
MPEVDHLAYTAGATVLASGIPVFSMKSLGDGNRSKQLE